MNWQECAIQDLRKYNGLKASMENIPERIRTLRLRMESVKCAATDRTPVQGGGSKMEDALLDNIVERERLKYLYGANKRLIRLTEKGLGALQKEERTVLDAFFVNRKKNHVEALCTDLGYEQAQIYRIKDTALYKFTVAMYGIIEY